MAPGGYDWWERKPCTDSMRCTGSPASSALAPCASPKCGMRPDGPLRGRVRRDWPPSACTRRCAPSADATHARLSYAGVWADGARSRMTARNAWSEGETTHRSFNQERFLDCVPFTFPLVLCPQRERAGVWPRSLGRVVSACVRALRRVLLACGSCVSC